MYSVSGCVSNIESGHKLDIVSFLALGGYRFSVLVCRCMGGECPLDELKMKVKEEKIPTFKFLLYMLIISSVKKA